MMFKIPYYAQTAEFTCGPACVLMILKHFDPHLKLNRSWSLRCGDSAT